MEKRMNKQELIYLIDSLKLDKNEFWILSSAALVMREIYPDAGDLDIAVTEKGLEELKENYSNDSRGINVEYLGNKFKLATKKEYHDYCKKLLEDEENNILSQSALETLAIIAYNEPITRIEIDEIRGVSSREMIKKLVAKGLVKETGRSDLPGRPILYETTNEFLDYFGLASVEDLPNIEEIVEEDQEEVEDSDLYTSKYGEEVKFLIYDKF